MRSLVALVSLCARLLRIRGELQIAIWIGAKLRTWVERHLQLEYTYGYFAARVHPATCSVAAHDALVRTLVPVWPLSFLRARHRPRRRERDRELPGGCGLAAEEQCV